MNESDDPQAAGDKLRLAPRQKLFTALVVLFLLLMFAMMIFIGLLREASEPGLVWGGEKEFDEVQTIQEYQRDVEPLVGDILDQLEGIGLGQPMLSGHSRVHFCGADRVEGYEIWGSEVRGRVIDAQEASTIVGQILEPTGYEGGDPGCRGETATFEWSDTANGGRFSLEVDPVDGTTFRYSSDCRPTEKRRDHGFRVVPEWDATLPTFDREVIDVQPLSRGNFPWAYQRCGWVRANIEGVVAMSVPEGWYQRESDDFDLIVTLGQSPLSDYPPQIAIVGYRTDDPQVLRDFAEDSKSARQDYRRMFAYALENSGIDFLEASPGWPDSISGIRSDSFDGIYRIDGGEYPIATYFIWAHDAIWHIYVVGEEGASTIPPEYIAMVESITIEAGLPATPAPESTDLGSASLD